MPDKEKKVFDVEKPGKSKPDIGSKPMIIGHKSLANDPMVKEDKEQENNSEKPTGDITTNKSTTEEKVLAESKKVKIEPISDDMKSKEEKPEEKIEEKPEVAEQIDKKEPGTKPKKEPEKEPTVKENKDVPDEEKKKKKDEKLDPAAEAMEKEHKLNQLIESKKYNVHINEAKSGALKTFLYVFFGLVIVGSIIFYLLIDTNTIDLNIDLPFSIFGS